MSGVIRFEAVIVERAHRNYNRPIRGGNVHVVMRLSWRQAIVALRLRYVQ